MDWFSLSLLAGVALLIPTAYAGKIGAPYAPTPRAIIEKAFALLNIGPGDTVVDLGAGDGKVLLAAAGRGAAARGYELSPFLYAVAWLRTLGKPVRLQFRNFYRQQLTDPTVIFAFLMPDNMPRVSTFLSQQAMPAGKYLLAYAFPLQGVAPINIIREKNCAPLYVYDLPQLTQPVSTATQGESV